jgi:raffinose/stachyose/melibiose transport system permease protein
VDGAGPLQVFFRVIFPVLRSVVITVIILQSVFVYNDFQNPLYFLPGTQNATVQLTLFSFRSQFTTQFNLLFANILLVMLPALIMFIIFNRKIVEGMAAGSVKG